MGLLLLIQLFVVALSLSQSTNGWGPEGHYMICKIAEPLLTKKTSKAVVDLLPEIAGGDCHDPKGEKNVCAVGAIYNYTKQLESYGDSSERYNLTESLMFLAHIMGDIHQPLHAGFIKDLGGNRLRVFWYQNMTNLHKVWDVNVLETAMSYFYANSIDTMMKAIERNITDGWSEEILAWESCGKSVVCPDKYATESVQLACNYAYKDVEQNLTLGDDYFYTRHPVVQKRIAQAGVRLAAVLNRIFDKSDDEKISEIAAV